MGAREAGSNPYYAGPTSEHFDGRTFFNPNGLEPKAFADLLRWQFGGGRARWPARWESPFSGTRPEAPGRLDGLRVTMVGHASMLLQTAGLSILTDPVWSNRVSPFSFVGPRRVNAPGIAFEDLPRIDAVLVSHNHYDHMDLVTLKRLKDAHDPLVIAPLGNDAIMRKAVPDLRVMVGDWGDSFELISGRSAARVHIEPAHHWSARGTGDRRMALWSAFVIEGPGGKVYFAGDTGFHSGINYAAAAAKHGRFRFAILPIGAYEPRWFMEGQHQNPEEAVEGMRLLQADYAAGCHWGTFRLTNEPIEEPRELLHAALDTRSVRRDRFRAMLPGEVWDLPG